MNDIDRVRVNSMPSDKELPEEKRPKIERVETSVRTRKKSLGSKFTETFVSEDAGNVRHYIFGEVLVPAVKSVISDMVTTGIEMLLYGETKSRKRSNRSSWSSVDSRTSYARYYDDRDRDTRRSTRSEERRRTSWDDLVFDRRTEAEDILVRMFEVVDKYDNISISELCDMTGLRAEYTDTNWGWEKEDLAQASVARSRDGYILKLPRPIYLKQG